MSDYIQEKLWNLIVSQTTETEAAWLAQKSEAGAREVMTAFVASPRFLSKKIIAPTADERQALQLELGGFSVEGWSLVRLSRVWLLTQLDSSDRDAYVKNIETLFDTAEMNELVALYSALPLLSYPDKWIFRATDAVRSNMGFVFDAIALRNPFAEKYFSEAAWNQLVLKTIFNDKPIEWIEGLDNRANAALAATLSDFAHERWAAGRHVGPQVWRLIAPFVNETLVRDLGHLLKSTRESDRLAAALAIRESDYEPAKILLQSYPEIEKTIEAGNISWSSLSE